MAIMDYRTRDGLADFGFSIEFQSHIGWRVYIIFDLYHLGGNGSRKLPYQATAHDGRRYVNWNAKLDNLGDARTVAALWAELAQRYERTQEQNAQYVELIKRYRDANGKTMAASVDPDRLDNAVGANPASSGHQYGGSVIPHPSITTEPSYDLQEEKWADRGRGTDEVA